MKDRNDYEIDENYNTVRTHGIELMDTVRTPVAIGKGCLNTLSGLVDPKGATARFNEDFTRGEIGSRMLPWIGYVVGSAAPFAGLVWGLYELAEKLQ